MRNASLIIFTCLLMPCGPPTGASPIAQASNRFAPTSCLDSSCILVAAHPREAAQRRLLPDEPEEYDSREVKAFYDWRNDLFFRHFDMEGIGRADFMTARRTYQVWLSEFGDPVVLTVANPLFYWVDFNRNGEFESSEGEMWLDPEEDGINGNERLYDVSDLQSAGPPLSRP